MPWKLGIAALLVVTACDGSARSPTEADTPPPLHQLVGTSAWVLTQSWVSLAGPDNCMVREVRSNLGDPYERSAQIDVQRSGIVVSIDLDEDFMEQFVGNIGGAQFQAHGGVGLPRLFICGDGTELAIQAEQNRVTGTFSSDGRRLTATETRSGFLDSGERLVLEVRWEGRRLESDF